MQPARAVQAYKGTHMEIDGQTVTTPKGSVGTVHGCRCKRSRCLKKYCACYGDGLKCGENCICEVTIIDDDEPGELSFEPPKEGDTPIVTCSETTGKVRVKVGRYNGSAGLVQCDYELVDGSASCGKEFGGEVGFEKEGTFVFENTEVEKFIEIPLINTNRYEGESEFKILLKNFKCPVERAKFGKHTELKVVITADTQTKEMIDNVQKYLESNDGGYEVGSATWGQQFKDAINVGGADAPDDFKPAPSDWVMHVITLPWKLAFAFVPPTCYMGGWLCFYVALIFIGIVALSLKIVKRLPPVGVTQWA